MRKKLLLAVITAFILLFPLAYAENGVSIDQKVVKNRILSDEWAVFDITIQNNQLSGDTLMISAKEEGVEWSILTESTYDYTTGVFLNSGEKKTTRILMKDKGLVPNDLKPYSVELSVKSLNSGKSASTMLSIFLLSELPVLFEPEINVSLNIPRYVDPRNVYSFKVNLVNNNKKNIRGLKVNLESSLVNREAFVELGPEQMKTIEFTVPFDENLKPTIDTLTVSVTEGDRKVYRSTNPIEVVPYRMPFEQSTNTIKSFLKHTTQITLTNKDNVEELQKFMLEYTFTDWLFSSTSPESEIVKKDGADYYKWDVQLKPGESYSLSIITDYKPLLYAFIVVIILFVIYYYAKNPVILLKSCDIVKTFEGGISELKIVIAIKNRKDRKFKTRLIDIIPHIAHVDKKDTKTEHDVVHPHRIMNTKKGIMLEWTFDLEPNEERFVAYYIKSKLSILGGLRMAPALAVLHDGKKTSKVKSNSVNVMEVSK